MAKENLRRITDSNNYQSPPAGNVPTNQPNMELGYPEASGVIPDLNGVPSGMSAISLGQVDNVGGAVTSRVRSGRPQLTARVRGSIDANGADLGAIEASITMSDSSAAKISIYDNPFGFPEPPSAGAPNHTWNPQSPPARSSLGGASNSGGSAQKSNHQTRTDSDPQTERGENSSHWAESTPTDPFIGARRTVERGNGGNTGGNAPHHIPSRMSGGGGKSAAPPAPLDLSLRSGLTQMKAARLSQTTGEGLTQREARTVRYTKDVTHYSPERGESSEMSVSEGDAIPPGAGGSMSAGGAAAGAVINRYARSRVVSRTQSYNRSVGRHPSELAEHIYSHLTDLNLSENPLGLQGAKLIAEVWGYVGYVH